MAECNYSWILCLLLVVSVALSLPADQSAGQSLVRLKRYVSRVRLCGDQLVMMLRMMCSHRRAVKAVRSRNAVDRRTTVRKTTSQGLSDRCCRSACTLYQLYEAC